MHADSEPSTHANTDRSTTADTAISTHADTAIRRFVEHHRRPWTVAIVNFKGGTGKTTTAAYLAHAWTAQGLRVTAVDADHPQYALQRWAELADWTLPVIGLGSKQLHERLPGILTTATTDVAVIDTPPLEEDRGVVTSALRAADLILVTLAPTTAELHRTGAIFDAIDDTTALRATPADVIVVLNRVDRRSKADRTVRAALDQAGYRVARQIVPLRQAYAQAFGSALVTDDIWTVLACELAATTNVGAQLGGVA